MRLIDAIGLKQSLAISSILADKKTLEQIIDEQPTIEERKAGRWIHHPEIGYGETWLCSECGEKTVSTIMGKPRYKWCPMCGARMMEVDG